MTKAEHFAERLRNRESLIGFWVMSDNAAATERIALLGYDYVCVDGQHGLFDYQGWVSALSVLDSRGSTAAGVVRVPANDPASIGRALDAGAQGVIVPLVNDAVEARAAVRACRYPPAGDRSYGPIRASLRIGPTPAAADEQVACLVMVETAAALDNIEEICATDGLDGLYVGPSDLSLALGGRRPGDPDITDRFDTALSTVVNTAERAGIACGVHCPDGATAARRLAEGFTFATVSHDLSHLEAAAKAQLRAARG